MTTKMQRKDFTQTALDVVRKATGELAVSTSSKIGEAARPNATKKAGFKARSVKR